MDSLIIEQPLDKKYKLSTPFTCEEKPYQMFIDFIHTNTIVMERNKEDLIIVMQLSDCKVEHNLEESSLTWDAEV